MIKAVILDFDGVIVDSEPLHFATESALVKKYHGLLSASIFKNTLGLSIKDTLKFYKKIFKIDKSIADTLKEYNKLFLQLVDSELKLNEGVKEILKLFKSLDLAMAIASSAQKKYVERMLKIFNLFKLFSGKIFSVEMVKHGKPAPDIYLLAAQKLDIKPQYCLVVEDALNGVLAAKSAGMKSLFLTHHPVKEKGLNTKVIKSLAEINLALLQTI